MLLGWILQNGKHKLAWCLHKMAMDAKEKYAKVEEGDVWRTVHPRPGEKGRPVLLDSSGVIKAGVGKKFIGQHIDLIPRKWDYKSRERLEKTDWTQLKPHKEAAGYESVGERADRWEVENKETEFRKNFWRKELDYKNKIRQSRNTGKFPNIKTKYHATLNYTEYEKLENWMKDTNEFNEKEKKQILRLANQKNVNASNAINYYVDTRKDILDINDPEQREDLLIQANKAIASKGTSEEISENIRKVAVKAGYIKRTQNIDSPETFKEKYPALLNDFSLKDLKKIGPETIESATRLYNQDMESAKNAFKSKRLTEQITKITEEKAKKNLYHKLHPEERLYQSERTLTDEINNIAYSEMRTQARKNTNGIIDLISHDYRFDYHKDKRHTWIQSNNSLSEKSKKKIFKAESNPIKGQISNQIATLNCKLIKESPETKKSVLNQINTIVETNRSYDNIVTELFKLDFNTFDRKIDEESSKESWRYNIGDNLLVYCASGWDSD